MISTQPSICRNCLAYCPIEVTVKDGRVIKVVGDDTGTPYEGYICPKGRTLPEQHNDPARLLNALRKGPDGQFKTVPARDVVDRVGTILQDIIARHGSDAVAMYTGTGAVSNPTGQIMAHLFFRAIKSRMLFSAATIDKPAANTSTALHGNWVAGAQRFQTADTWMIVGANPVIAKSNGAPSNNPGQRLKEAVNRGMKLIVIDPRRTETARRAHVHLQAMPGEDPTVLAGLIRIIIDEGLCDVAFIAQNAQGFEQLKAAVEPFTPEYVAARAGISADDLVEAARTFGGGKTGSVVCSTGPSFAPRSDLSYYLALCINTICGRWGREGMRAAYQNIMLPPYTPKAQPYPPYPVFGKTAMRVHGMRQNASGLPTAALADEILLDEPRQIKALFCVGGNPIHAWPDQDKTRAALEKLELLVVFDINMTATAEYADFIVAPPMTLEIPGTTSNAEALKYIGVSRGIEMPWAQYTDKVVNPSAGSDLMDEGEFFFRVAQKLGLQLNWTINAGYGPHIETPSVRIPFDMDKIPSVEDLITLSCSTSRVPLEEVRKYPHGHLFNDVQVVVEPRDPACTARLQLADPMIMRELAEVIEEDFRQTQASAEFPLRLICRRTNNFMNSVGTTLPALHRGKRYNPVCMCLADMKRVGVTDNDLVRVQSPSGEVLAVVESDDSLRPGTISMSQGFGPRMVDGVSDPRVTGAPVTALIGLNDHDPITGMPKMSAVPVAIAKAAFEVCGI